MGQSTNGQILEFDKRALEILELQAQIINISGTLVKDYWDYIDADTQELLIKKLSLIYNEEELGCRCKADFDKSKADIDRARYDLYLSLVNLADSAFDAVEENMGENNLSPVEEKALSRLADSVNEDCWLDG